MLFDRKQFNLLDYWQNTLRCMDNSKLITIITVGLVMLMGIIYAVYFTPQYKTVAILENKIFSDIGNIVLDARTKPIRSLQNVNRELDLIQTDAVYDLAINKIMTNKSITAFTSSTLRKYIRSNVKFVPPIHTATMLKQGVVMPYMDLIEISLISQEPVIASQIVNALAEAAVEVSSQRIKTLATNTINILMMQYAKIERSLTDPKITINETEARQALLATILVKIERIQAIKIAPIPDINIVQPAIAQIEPITYSRMIIILFALAIGILFSYILKIALH